MAIYGGRFESTPTSTRHDWRFTISSLLDMLISFFKVNLKLRLLYSFPSTFVVGRQNEELLSFRNSCRYNCYYLYRYSISSQSGLQRPARLDRKLQLRASVLSQLSIYRPGDHIFAQKHIHNTDANRIVVAIGRGYLPWLLTFTTVLLASFPGCVYTAQLLPLNALPINQTIIYNFVFFTF